MKQVLFIMGVGFLGTILLAAPARPKSGRKAAKSAAVTAPEKPVPDTSAKRDTAVKKEAAVAPDTAARRDTAAAKAPVPLPDSTKAGKDTAVASATLEEDKILSECEELDASNPLAPRTFDEVNAVLGGSVGKVMSRYLALQRTQPGLKGKLEIAFVISPEGKVNFSKISVNTLKHPELESRALEAVSRAVFPARSPGTRPVLVRYPLYFLPW